MRPPLVMRIKIRNREHDFSLWIPLFLFLPVLLALGIILLPLLLILAIVLIPFGLVRLALVVPYVVALLGRLHGLKVDIENDKEKVFISFH